MVEFAGYSMPLQYPDASISESTKHTRSCVSLFDVSHMLQTEIYGKDRVHFLESLTTADISGLGKNRGTLSVFTNDKGGIRDDLILSNTNNETIYMVSNAGCIDKDLPYLQVFLKLLFIYFNKLFSDKRSSMATIWQRC